MRSCCRDLMNSSNTRLPSSAEVPDHSGELMGPSWSHHTFSSHLGEVSLCVSPPHHDSVTLPDPPHTHSGSVKNSIKTSKADAGFAWVFSPLLFIYRCIPSFIYVHFKVFIKMQRIFAFLTYTSSICQFPPYCTWELSWLVRLCKFVFLCFSLIPSLTSAPGVRLFLSGKNPNIISALAQLHNLSVSVNFVLHFGTRTVSFTFYCRSHS